MAMKKISEFVSATPTSADKILFEQNEKGKSCSIGDAVNTCSLTYEEIMASTDLSGKVASASVLKSLGNELNNFSILKSFQPFGTVFNIDDLANYPRGTAKLSHTLFNYQSTGTKPFKDGHLLTFIWNNVEGNKNYLSQIAFEDNGSAMKIRGYEITSWSSWKTVSIS